MVLTQEKENVKENVSCKQSSKVDAASQEEHAYRELISRHANTRLQLEVGGIIGRGSFGTVHTARWRDGRAGRSVVVKRVRTVGLAEKAQRQVMREAVLQATDTTSPEALAHAVAELELPDGIGTSTWRERAAASVTTSEAGL